MTETNAQNMIDWTGERYVPWADLGTPEIHYEHLHRYRFASQFVNGKTVLDLASGEGYGCAMLAETARQVTGIELDEKAVKHAVSRYPLPNITFLTGSMTNIPIKGERLFDVITCFEALEHIADHDALLAEVSRLLKDDGLFIVSTPNKFLYTEQRGQVNPFHVKELHLGEFEDLLKRKFSHSLFLGQTVLPASFLWTLDKELGIYTNYCVAKSDKEGFVSVSTSHQIPLYFIALASNSPIENNAIFSTLTDVSDELINSYRRIIDDKERKRKVLEGQIQAARNQLLAAQGLLKQKDEIITGHLGHIDLLLVKERELNKVYASRGWRLLKGLYGLENVFLPPKSRRRFLFKLFFKFIKNPAHLVSGAKLRNIKKVISLARKGDIGFLENKVNDYLEVRFPTENIDVNGFVGTIIAREKIVFKQEDHPLVSIIIPVYNQWQHTHRALAAIFKYTNSPSYEVIVADDVSTDDTVNIVEHVENVHVIRNEANLGFLLNCNNAARSARGKFILFLNNDTIVQSEWLKSMVEVMDRDNTIGLVGPKLIYPDGRLQEAGGIIWSDASGCNYGRLDDRAKPEYNYVKEVDYISGACIMIRSALWKEVGGFDERFAPAYYEDTDLAFEVRKRGYKVVYQPKSVVVHNEGVSHGTDFKEGVKKHQVQNREKFLSKWIDILSVEHFASGTEVFWARDRSQRKKTILVIDHYVPHYDKDAGSRCTYLYLKLLCELGYNVKFMGDNFFKHEPYTSHLEQMGIEILYGHWYSKNYQSWISENANKLDYAWLSRPHISIKYIDFLKKHTRAKILYFGHDLHFIREQAKWKLENDNLSAEAANYWKKTEFELFDKSDTILTVSTEEESVIKEHFPDKKVIVFPLYYFEEEAKVNTNFDSRDNIMFVGGFTHLPNVDAVKWFAKSVLPGVIEAIPTVKLYVVGSNPPEEIIDLQGDNIIVEGFVSDKELIDLYNKVKLVVIPLRFGAGVKGKTIEAMYHRVPIVSTRFGLEGIEGIGDIIQEKNSDEEFRNEVISLYLNEDKFEKAGKQYAEFISTYFSKESATNKIIRAFD